MEKTSWVDSLETFLSGMETRLVEVHLVQDLRLETFLSGMETAEWLFLPGDSIVP